jgi:two-component system, sporulation sensor kinase B
MRQDTILQVIHDMQSPLMALSLMTSTLSEVSAEKRSTILSAVEKVIGLADYLRGIEPVQDPTQDWSIIESWIDPLMDEKRVEFSSQKIEFHKISLLEKSFVSKFKIKNMIHSLDFQRVFSNLLNNAAEASDSGSPVVLRLMIWKNSLCIAIEDEGEGFDPLILKKAGTLGLTTKPKGSGRGLFHAIQVVEREWDGELIIDSCEKQGTTIRILLPIEFV